jgi:hypothetical protein
VSHGRGVLWSFIARTFFLFFLAIDLRLFRGRFCVPLLLLSSCCPGRISHHYGAEFTTDTNYEKGMPLVDCDLFSFRFLPASILVRPILDQKRLYLFSRIWHNLEGTPVQDGVVTDDHRRHGCRNAVPATSRSSRYNPVDSCFGSLEHELSFGQKRSCREFFDQYATSTNADAVSVDASTPPEPCRDGIALVLLLIRFCPFRAWERQTTMATRVHHLFERCALGLCS